MRFSQKRGKVVQKQQQAFDAYLSAERKKWEAAKREKWASDLTYDDWNLERLMRTFGEYYSRRVISQRYIRMAIAAGKYREWIAENYISD